MSINVNQWIVEDYWTSQQVNLVCSISISQTEPAGMSINGLLCTIELVNR